MAVTVGDGVRVTVGVGVLVRVAVSVAVGVRVRVGVGVTVAVSVAVTVGLSVADGVGELNGEFKFMVSIAKSDAAPSIALVRLKTTLSILAPELSMTPI